MHAKFTLLLTAILSGLSAVHAAPANATIPLSPITHNEFGEPHTPDFAAELAAHQAEIENGDVDGVASFASVATVTTLSSAQISAFRPFTYYAGAAYCSPATTRNWSCGANCNANSGFIPTASGGDGALTQYWYVGYDPTLQSVIVAHQGTDASKILPVITNINFDPRALDGSLFPGVPSNVRVHDGFGDAQERSAAAALAAVRTTISQRGASKVTVVGHSLGGAIGLLSALHLKLQLPSSVNVQYRGYGIPRVGNPAFATYIDSLFGTSGAVQRVANLRDPVPILPGRFLGFAHTSGEIHIGEGGVWNSCAGQDNTDARCTVGAVPNVFVGRPEDHSGPFDGVMIGC